jgi:hypothetical protein
MKERKESKKGILILWNRRKPGSMELRYLWNGKRSGNKIPGVLVGKTNARKGRNRDTCGYGEIKVGMEWGYVWAG